MSCTRHIVGNCIILAVVCSRRPPMDVDQKLCLYFCIYSIKRQSSSTAPSLVLFIIIHPYYQCRIYPCRSVYTTHIILSIIPYPAPNTPIHPPISSSLRPLLPLHSLSHTDPINLPIPPPNPQSANRHHNRATNKHRNPLPISNNVEQRIRVNLIDGEAMLQPHPIPSRNGRGDQHGGQKSERPRWREEENVDE